MTNGRNTLDATTKAVIAGVCGGVFAVSLAFLVPEMNVGASTPDEFDPGVSSTAGLQASESAPDAGAAGAPFAAAPDSGANAPFPSRVPAAEASPVSAPTPIAASDLPNAIPAEEEPAAIDDVPDVSATAPFPRRTTVEAMPEPAPVAAAPQPIFVTLVAGTPIEVELLDSVSSQTSAVGDSVAAVIARDVIEDELVVLPAGSRLGGSVVEVVRQKKIGGQSVLVVGFDELEVAGGESVPVSATLALAGEKQTEKDAAIMAGSTAGGALLGRVLKKSDRSKGTLIGAVLGAAVGTAVAAKNESDPIELPAGSLASLSLDVPVEIAVERSAGSTLAELR